MLLAVGVGHMEKFFLLALVRFCRKLFVGTIAYKFMFSIAYNLLLSLLSFVVTIIYICWQTFSITYEAFSEELLYIYVKDCLERNIERDPNHFTVWRETEVKSNNYHLYYEIAFNVLLGMKFFRPGIQQNIKEIKTFISTNESYSRSGGPSKGEGGDYVTENENRHLKSHLSPGVPFLKNWQEAARNYNILTKNIKMLFKRLSITDPSSEDRSTFRILFFLLIH